MLPRVPSAPAILRGFLILASLLGASLSLRADVIYSNFGPGDSYAAGTGLIVTNDDQAYSSLAIGFTPSADYTLTSIEFVATSLIPDDSADITIGIFADNGTGQPGGAPIESFTVGGLGTFGDDAAPVLTVNSLLQPLLQADMTYWIGINAAPGDMVVWNQNITGALGYSSTDGSGNWSSSPTDQGVVEIDGTLQNLVSDSSQNSPASSTPEPRAWSLLAGGLAALALTARRGALRPSAAKVRARFPDQK